jgi:hypothetical protein
MTQPRLDVDSFLPRFFGDANRFDLATIESDTEGGTGRIRPWIKRLRKVPPHFSILPCWRGGTHVDWYAVAHSERELRKLREELLAFVGPSYSDFRGQRAILDLSDPVEVAVHELTNGAAFKFQGPASSDGAQAIWNALELMRKTWSRRTERDFEVQKSKGRVLRDFYMALQAGNQDSAENQLAYLRRHIYLDAHNLVFLRIQLFATFGFWRQILDLTELPDILMMRRPLLVTQSAIQAVYHEELAVFEDDGDSDRAIGFFESQILPRYGQLYTAHAGMKAPEAIKSFMLLAVSSKPPRLGLCKRLLEFSDIPEADQNYLKALYASLADEETEGVEGDALQLSLRSLEENDFDQAYGLALRGMPSTKRTQLLLRCSYELQTLESRNTALKAFNALAAEKREGFLQSRLNQNLLEALREETSEDNRDDEPNIPTSWPEWFTRLRSDAEWEPEVALQVARQGAMEWDVAELLTEPNAIAIIGESLKSSSYEEILHNALPSLLMAFQSEPFWPRREFSGIYWGMLELLVYSTHGGDDDLAIFNDLVAGIMTCGVNESQYQDILEYGKELWKSWASPSKIDWFLDFIDQLCLFPRVSDESLLVLLNEAAVGFGRFFRRIQSEQWSVFRLVCEDLGQSEIYQGLENSDVEIDGEEITKTEDKLSILQGKLVAIYTLTEKVGQRVGEILGRLCEGVRVQVFSGKVGTPQLRDLARNADVFVMATASATHAATGFIKSNRPALPILYPKGKGSASMVREVCKYAVQVRS